VSSTAQFDFAAEFVTFLAAAAGLALVLLRGELLTRRPWARVTMGAGFLAAGVAAFLRGSLVFDEVESEFMLAVRAAGLIAIAAGSLAWTGSEGGRRLLWIGVTFMAVSLVADFGDVQGVVNVTLALGAVGIGASMLTASRHSIAARVAASAAVALLLMVLVLSLSLSAVLVSTVEDEQLRRLDARALTEVSQIENEPREVVLFANVVGFSLGGGRQSILRQLKANPAQPALIASLTDDLRELSRNFTDRLPLAYMSNDGKLLATYLLDQDSWILLSQSDAVKEALSQNTEVATVALAGRSQLLATAVVRVLVRNSPDPQLGWVIAAKPLDRAYLDVQARQDRALSLGVMTQEQLLTRFRALPSVDDLRPLARTALVEGRSATGILDDRFVAVRPVLSADRRPVAALVAANPSDFVGDTREELFRTLFLIALGGTMLALVIASLVGDRIGSGVRQLTVAAEGIQQGDFSVRAGVVSEDELGVLGSAFDSMAESIEEKTGALREAADAETRLRNRLEAVVAGMGEALVAVDASGAITDFNQAAEELVGMTAAEARGRPADQVIRIVSDDGDDLGGRLRKPLPRRWSVTGSITQADGATAPVALSAGALRGPSAELVGGVFVIRDLRREREVERMKTEFLSHIGHELRTPLAGVLGHSEILLRRELPPETARISHEEILKSGRRLERVVEMLEFFASAGAGRVRLRREPLDVRSVVDEVVGRWSDKVDGHHRITRRVARDVPPVEGDRRWLTLSLDELLDNAVKFSPDGGRISVTAVTGGNGRRSSVEITVADQGKGMTPDEQELAFTDFVQGDGSDTRSYGGLGLGLALVKRVAEAHGGEVHVESRPGKGSKLSIVLPGAPKKRRR
jgi:PAS domain S-box-containing protein